MTYAENILDYTEILCKEYIETFLLLSAKQVFIFFFYFSFGCSFLSIEIAFIL